LLTCRKQCKITGSQTAAKKELRVNVTKLIALGAFTLFLSPQMLFAQAFGEYGKTVGGAGQRQGNVNQKASRASSHNSNGKSVAEGIGDMGRPVPSTLVVVSKQAGLYPRHDDETEKIAELSQGDTLIPMGQ